MDDPSASYACEVADAQANGAPLPLPVPEGGADGAEPDAGEDATEPEAGADASEDAPDGG
jgi:hypothetical protein